MFDYWLLLTLTVGVVGLFFVVNKKIQANEAECIKSDLETCNSKIKKINLEEVEKKIVLVLEKMLKRLRVLVLRMDNNISKFLKKLRSQKNEEKIFSVSKLTSYEVISDSERETTRILEINYLESIKSNPNVDSFLKLAELYMNCKDFNSCRALLYRAWELDKSNDKLLRLVKDLKDLEKEKSVV